jgi:hypothetical protein
MLGIAKYLKLILFFGILFFISFFYSCSKSNFTMEGTVISRTFVPEHTEPHYSGGAGHASGRRTKLSHYMIGIRIDNGKTVQMSWPSVATIDYIPIGQRVSVQCLHYNLWNLWEKTYALEMIKLDK